VRCDGASLSRIAALCKWKARRCRRAREWSAWTSDDEGALHQEDDGPLSAIYDRVLSVEMIEGGGTATLMVFFYGSYATALDPLVGRGTSFVLDNVMAKCVLPRESGCCICIGDESELTSRSKGMVSHIRFDDGVDIRLVEDEVEYIFNCETLKKKGLVVANDSKMLERKKRKRNADGGNSESAWAHKKSEDMLEDGVTAMDVTTNGVMATQFYPDKPFNRWKENKGRVEYQNLANLEAFIPKDGSRQKSDVNIMGVVMSFSAPSRTKWNQWMISLTLVDNSIPLALGESTSVVMNIFVTSMNKLPHFSGMGNVLCAHRVMVQEYNGAVQLVGNKDFSSFLTILPKCPDTPDAERLDAEHWNVLATAEKSYSFSPDEEVRSLALWEWGQNRIRDHATMNEEQQFFISKLGNTYDQKKHHVNVHGDATVMITSIIPIPSEARDNTSPYGFLRVWDGSGPSIIDRHPVDCTPFQQEDPPTAAVKSVASIVKELNNALPDASILTPMSLLGRVINVAIWEWPMWSFIMGEGMDDTFNPKPIRIGQLVRMRNVHDGLIRGLRCLNVNEKSCVTPLPPCVYEIRERLIQHQARIRDREPPNLCCAVLPPNSEPIPSRSPGITAADESVDLHRMVDCLAEPASRSFLARFKIEGIHPSGGLRSLCRRDKTKFRFVLLVCDRTADLNLLVRNDVAEALLGISADLLGDDAVFEKGQDELRRLLDRTSTWQGRIRSALTSDGIKYFLLESGDPLVFARVS